MRFIYVQALLDKVLSTGQLSVISNTVARLGSREAVEVFGEAVDRLHSRPARAAMLLPWLRAVLLSHSSYLAVSGVAKGHVSTLQQLVSARVALLEPMLALRGRIDFVLAHAATQRAQTAGMSDKPPLVRRMWADCERVHAPCLSSIEDALTRRQWSHVGFAHMHALNRHETSSHRLVAHAGGRGCGASEGAQHGRLLGREFDRFAF